MNLSGGQTVQREIPDDLIDLGFGQPDPALLPLGMIREASALRLSGSDPSLLQYGHERGPGVFRGALAGFLGEAQGSHVDPDSLFVTTGASTALDLVCREFARPGDTVFVEEPSYFLALRIFADRGLVVKGIPADEDGIIPEALEALLREEVPAFLYTIPAFHNPTGATLSDERRRRIVSLSTRYGFLVLADEVYQFLSFGETPPPPSMSAYDQAGTVLSVGSFSKILAPGLRLGWIQAAHALIGRLTGSGLLQSSGGLNPFTASLMEPVISRGLLRRHIDVLRTTYGRRASVLADSLGDYLPRDVRFRVPAGGFFVWVELPEHEDADGLLPGAEALGVAFLPGRRFSSREGLRNRMRLSFSFYGETLLREGARRLGELLKGSLG